MSTAENDQIAEFFTELEDRFGHLGGVSCADLLPENTITQDPLMSELVFSILVWESSIQHALNAIEHMNEQLVDLNELRVCSPDELVRIFPARYPRSLERCQRLISVLNTIFEVENQLSLSRLKEMTKKQVQEYLNSIYGLPPFAASRVILYGLGWHAIPLDEWLVKELSRVGLTENTTDVNSQSLKLERAVRSSDSLRFYNLLEHWATERREEKLSARTSTRSRQSNAKS